MTAARQTVCGVIRRLWPDRNPLRRTTDRVEAAIVAVLCAVLLAGIPLASIAAFGWANATGMRNQQAEAGWRQVPAVLLQNAPEQAHPRSQGSPEPLVRARWTAPDGAQREGKIRAPGGTRAGMSVPMWTDRSGTPEAAPQQGADVTAWDAFVAAAAAMGVAVAVAAAGFVARVVLLRRRLAAWDAAWPLAESQWTGRR